MIAGYIFVAVFWTFSSIVSNVIITAVTVNLGHVVLFSKEQEKNTVDSRYNAVVFYQNNHNRKSIARP